MFLAIIQNNYLTPIQVVLPIFAVTSIQILKIITIIIILISYYHHSNSIKFSVLYLEINRIIDYISISTAKQYFSSRLTGLDDRADVYK